MRIAEMEKYFSIFSCGCNQTNLSTKLICKDKTFSLNINGYYKKQKDLQCLQIFLFLYFIDTYPIISKLPIFVEPVHDSDSVLTISHNRKLLFLYLQDVYTGHITSNISN